MYCIYSGKVLDDDEMNIEHIIPLSLGGCDSFTIMVGKKINSDLGSKIDGKFCNDFLIGLQQLPFDNKMFFWVAKWAATLFAMCAIAYIPLQYIVEAIPVLPIMSKTIFITTNCKC